MVVGCGGQACSPFKNLSKKLSGEGPSLSPTHNPQPPTSDLSPLHPLSLNQRPSQTFPPHESKPTFPHAPSPAPFCTSKSAQSPGLNRTCTSKAHCPEHPGEALLTQPQDSRSRQFDRTLESPSTRAVEVQEDPPKQSVKTRRTKEGIVGERHVPESAFSQFVFRNVRCSVREWQ